MDIYTPHACHQYTFVMVIKRSSKTPSEREMDVAAYLPLLVRSTLSASPFVKER